MKKRLLFLAALAAVAPVSVRAVNLSLGLAAQYEFDGNTNDTSGNGLHFTTAAGVFEYVADRNGNAGKAVHLTDAANNGTFFLGTGPNLANRSSSVSFWIKLDSLSAEGSWVFGLGHPAGTGGSLGQDMHVAVNYGFIPIRYAFFYDDFNVYPPIAAGEWFNVAATFDYSSRERAIYLNGNLVATNTAAFPFSGGNALKMGFEGSALDDFRFYDRVLSGAEVQALVAPQGVPEVGSTAVLLGTMFLVGVAISLRRSFVPKSAQG